MLESEKRIKKIKELIEQHNISTGLLSELTRYSRASINQSLNNAYRKLNETMYKELLSAIEKIKNNDFPPEAKGYHVEFTRTTKPNSEAIIKFVRENKIPFKVAASMMGLTSHQLKGKLAENRRSDIPQDFKDEILSKLKKHYDL